MRERKWDIKRRTEAYRRSEDQGMGEMAHVLRVSCGLNPEDDVSLVDSLSPSPVEGERRGKEKLPCSPEL